ncbi:MAG TPA: UDP-glucose/GDP-mannose dehydrogenase family protein [Candidatus Saccharimonadales bacterium]|nr:UDP-glucose/GDP-mannose dehydrogenase family protein [Candidatus Saccharimonadales bacterium]
MKISVIGTGYVGLVTGTCLAEVGHDVTCVDIDETKISNLKKGIIPIYEPGLSELVLKNFESGSLKFTNQSPGVKDPEAIIFALPTPPNGDGEADLSYLLGAITHIAPQLKKYTVLVNKSTVPVGTAAKVTELAGSLTKTPFDVVSNPEFLKEGFAVEDFMKSDRIVIGSSSPKAVKVMQRLYAPFAQQGVPIIVMDEASSEMTKYAANSFLATKISFMNEIANICELTGANVEDVRRGIGIDPRIGGSFLRAGIGYGGSCFPKDVLALHTSSQLHDYDFKILEAVMQVNERQRDIFCDKVAKYIGDLKGKKLAVWGLSFKPNTDDIRESPPLGIISRLLGLGANIVAYDPEAAENVKKILGDKIIYAKTAIEATKNADALLLLTEWDEFVTADLKQVALSLKNKLIVDGRNAYNSQDVKNAGIKYVSVGRKVM